MREGTGRASLPGEERMCRVCDGGDEGKFHRHEE